MSQMLPKYRYIFSLGRRRNFQIFPKLEAWRFCVIGLVTCLASDTVLRAWNTPSSLNQGLRGLPREVEERKPAAWIRRVESSHRIQDELLLLPASHRREDLSPACPAGEDPGRIKSRSRNLILLMSAEVVDCWELQTAGVSASLQLSRLDDLIFGCPRFVAKSC